MNNIKAIERHDVGNERGFILVATMLMLVVLTLIGISATRTSNIELQIAGNEKWSQESFYQADGATETTISIIEESIFIGGIDSNDYYDTYVNNLNFYLKEQRDLYKSRTDTGNTDDFDWSFDGDPPAFADRDKTKVDVYLPRTAMPSPVAEPTTPPFTRVKAAAVSAFTPGSALHMASGYEGFGKSSAHGGAQMLYDIWSNNLGRSNSETMLRLQYRHVN